jgi:Transcriptional regulator, AbiEi antitoxin
MSVGLRTMGLMSRNEFPADYARLLYRQGGVFSRAQAISIGFSDSTIDARVRRGTWRRVYPGVYRERHDALTGPGQLWAALLYAGRGAVLSHQTAGYLGGLIGKPDRVVHVTVPQSRRVQRQPGLRVYRSRRAAGLALADASLPRTSVAETLLDLSEQTATFDVVYDMVCGAISRGLTTEADLLAALAARPRLAWRGELHPMIAAAAAGDHSVLELRYTRDVERRHGLPRSVRQVPFVTDDGQRGRRDRGYPEYGLIVELDGQLGHTGTAVSKDRARDRAAAVAGQQSMRFGWQEVAYQACAAAAEVAGVLRLRGWAGRPLPCGPGCAIRRLAG